MVEPEDAGLSLHSNGSCKNSQTFMERPGKLGGLLELSIGEAFMLRPSQSITISKRSNKKSTQKLLKLYRTALPSFPLYICKRYQGKPLFLTRNCQSALFAH